MIDTFLTILGSYVFPIAACCAMAFYVKYMYDQTNERIDKINEQHKNEVDNLSEVIKNNTIALQKINILIKELKK